jgi:hypothetical protein
MILEGARQARGGPKDPRGAAEILCGMRVITEPQCEAALMFGALWRRNDPLYWHLIGQCEADLIKVNAVDLARRVCRDHDVNLALARLGELRLALDLLALRFKQIELSVSRDAPTERAAGPAIL